MFVFINTNQLDIRIMNLNLFIVTQEATLNTNVVKPAWAVYTILDLHDGLFIDN